MYRAFLLFLVLALGAALYWLGAGSGRYYVQAVWGHARILAAAQPVAQLLQPPASAPSLTPAARHLQERLALAQQLRLYASDVLALPRNASYTRYADIARPAVVWNVVAAPAYGLEPKSNCFLFMGCVSYQGFYAQADAQALAQQLAQAGWEVYLYGVPAYSTLGYLNWLGGDPLLSTFIQGEEGDLAALIFHELAHQVLYVSDDSTFNEGFATAVERLGVARWLARPQVSDAVRSRYASSQVQRARFRTLNLSVRRELAAIYAHADWTVAQKQAAKVQAMEQWRTHYAALQAAGQLGRQYDAWVAGANNAYFAGLATYDELVPEFEAVLEHSGQDFGQFYAQLRRIAPLPKEARRAALRQLASGPAAF